MSFKKNYLEKVYTFKDEFLENIEKERQYLENKFLN
jgi:hypothetical protein